MSSYRSGDCLLVLNWYQQLGHGCLHPDICLQVEVLASNLAQGFVQGKVRRQEQLSKPILLIIVYVIF